MAKEPGIVDWHAMRKDQLIRALTPPPTTPDARRREALARKIYGQSPGEDGRSSPLLPGSAGQPASSSWSMRGVKDRIIAMVPNPYWLHATVAKALDPGASPAALGQDWHTPGTRPPAGADFTSEDHIPRPSVTFATSRVNGGVNTCI